MPSLHDRGGQRGGGGAGLVPEEQRQFPLVAEPHPLPLAGHQERPGKCAAFSTKPLYVPSVGVVLTSVFPHRTACGRVRNRSSPCWNLVSDKLSNTASPRRPNGWRKTWTCLARRQTSGTLTSERMAFHDESPHLRFCWVWALAKSFTGHEGKRSPPCTPPSDQYLDQSRLAPRRALAVDRWSGIPAVLMIGLWPTTITSGGQGSNGSLLYIDPSPLLCLESKIKKT